MIKLVVTLLTISPLVLAGAASAQVRPDSAHPVRPDSAQPMRSDSAHPVRPDSAQPMRSEFSSSGTPRLGPADAFRFGASDIAGSAPSGTTGEEVVRH